MQLSPTHSAIDPVSAWLLANGAARCNRMAAIITAADCKRNQDQTYVDCRCNGCGGLDNQVEQQPERPTLSIVWDADKVTAPDDLIDGLDVLDTIIDGLYEDPAPGDEFEDLEIELDDEELLKLFPELAGEEEKLLPFREYQEAALRRAVYRGRCKRCGGYMENTRERHDDNVFHCLACGWRTSPEYVRNRQIHAKGGVIL